MESETHSGTAAVSGTTVTMRDKLISDIKISKVSVTGTTATELAGASMKLYEGKTVTGAPTGALVDSWTSGTTVHEIAGTKLKADQEYTLYEEIAPDGYKVATNITFKVGKDGKVTNISTNAYTTSDAANGLIVMEDEAIPVIPEEKKVTLSKKAVGGSEELPGAKLSIYKKSDCTSGVPSSTATAVTTWTSGTTAKTIVIGTEAGKIAPGEYVLVEDGAPAGYAYTESIEFKIAEDGTVTSPATGAVSGSTVTMKDKELDFYVSKLDLDGNEIADAKLAIYEWNHDTKTVKGAALDKWNSSDKEAHVIYTDKFVASKSDSDKVYYVIKETTIPQGYEAVKDGEKTLSETVFTVTKDGKLKVEYCYDSSKSAEISKDVKGYTKTGTYSASSKKVVAGSEGDGLIISNVKTVEKTNTKKEDNPDDNKKKEEKKEDKKLPDTGGVVGSVALSGLAFMLILSGIVIMRPRRREESDN